MVRGDGMVGGRSVRFAGFTIVELMIVIAIIAIISALAIFVLGRGGEERAVRALSSEISQQLMSARMTAISRGQSVRVQLQTDAADRSMTLEMRRMRSPVVGMEVMEGCPQGAPSDLIVERTYRADTGAFRSASVSDVWPSGVGGEAVFCFMPSGRVLGGDGLPMQSGIDNLTGNAYIQIAGARQTAEGWELSPIRRIVLQVPLNGVVTQMPPSFVRDMGGAFSGSGEEPEPSG